MADDTIEPVPPWMKPQYFEQRCNLCGAPWRRDLGEPPGCSHTEAEWDAWAAAQSPPITDKQYTRWTTVNPPPIPQP